MEMLYARGEPCFANVTAKRVLPGRFPVEIGHVVPAPLAEPLRSDLVASTQSLASEAGFVAGALHCEWIVDDGGGDPVLIECAARLPGDEIVTLISLAYGFPLVETYVRTLLGHRPKAPLRGTAASAIRFLVAPRGRIAAVNGVEAVSALPGVESVRLSIDVGATVAAPRSSWDRAGYVLTRAKSADVAVAIAEKGIEMISFETR